MKVERQQDESLKQYQIRLAINKDTYDLTWDGIAELITHETGEYKSPTSLRKWWSAYHDGYDTGLSERLSGDEVTQQLEDKRIATQKEIERLKDQRRVYNDLIRQQARSEYIRSELVNAIHKLGEVKPIEWTPSPKQFYTNRESVQLFTDWHRGLLSSNYWNTFDNNEFERRIKRLVEKSIQYNHDNGVRTVHIVLGGDLVHGLIHVTTRIMATEDVITQIQMVSETLAQMLAEYANQFDMIKVYSISGNHGRVSPKKEESVDKENFEHIIPWFLQARLAHISNIEFMKNTYDEDIVDATVAGWSVAAVHGHMDNPHNVVQNITLMTGHKPSYLYMGHIHKYYRDEIHGVWVIVSPSLSGTDEYAKSKRLTSAPGQLLTIFDEHEGELCTYPIRLDIQ